MKPENVTCPLCGGPMVPRTSARGKFWGCRKFPNCRGTRNADGEVGRQSMESGELPAEREARLPSEVMRDNDRRRRW